MSLSGNWIDLVIIVVLLVYVLDGLGKGFFILAGNLLSFLTSLILALRFYPLASHFLIANFSLSSGIANALGFLAVAMISGLILGTIVVVLHERLPKSLTESPLSKALGIFPAILDALIIITFILTMVVVLPMSGSLKKDVTSSNIGGYLIRKTGTLERTVNEVFGGAVHDTLTFLTVKPQTGEKVDLRFQLKAQDLKVDEQSENIMLTLVNKERTKIGLKPLVVDTKISEVARNHSRDMFEKGYFSHIDPDGLDPFQRMEKGGIQFTSAGENIAFAPDVYIAHEGFMNSEGHRKNILTPEFGRVGIGIIDGGIYGKMFTQDFAD
ncbi:MAG: CvpA family protein [bacterium]|nr:CvpA family protein [bacterium]